MKECIVSAMVKALKATDNAMHRAIKEHDALMASYASRTVVVIFFSFLRFNIGYGYIY